MKHIFFFLALMIISTLKLVMCSYYSYVSKLNRQNRFVLNSIYFHEVILVTLSSKIMMYYNIYRKVFAKLKGTCFHTSKLSTMHTYWGILLLKVFKKYFVELSCNWKIKITYWPLKRGFKSPWVPYFCNFRTPTAFIFLWNSLPGFCVFQVKYFQVK